MGARLALPPHPGEPPLELVRTLCARAGLRLADADLAQVASVLAAHGEAVERLRALAAPDDDGPFDVAWR